MLRVITYHRIAEATANPDLDPALVSASPEAFRRQMEHLRRWYRPVSLAEVMHAFEDGRALPHRSVLVTVDDAYRDFRECAWPVLRALEIPVTVFVPTAYPDEQGRSFWWDRLHRAGIQRGRLDDTLRTAAAARDLRLQHRGSARNLRAAIRSLPHDDAESLVDHVSPRLAGDGAVSPATSAVLSWDELRRLQDEGVTFGAHTRHHVALTSVGADRVREEIRGSIDDLDRQLGPRRRAIAYPYGMHNATVARIAEEEGCVLGFTSEDGLNAPGRTPPLRLRRTNITPRTSPAVFAIRMLPWVASVDRWRHRHERLLLTT